MPFPHRPQRPSPDALNRREVADELGQPYHRVYYWTAAPATKNARQVVTPSAGDSERKGDPAWFTPDDVEQLREFFDALDTVQRFTGRRRRAAWRPR